MPTIESEWINRSQQGPRHKNEHHSRKEAAGIGAVQSLWLRLAKEMNDTAYQGVLCQHFPTILLLLTTRSEAGRFGGKKIV